MSNGVKFLIVQCLPGARVLPFISLLGSGGQTE